MFDEREERGEKSQNQSKRHALFPIEKNNRVGLPETLSRGPG